MIPTEQPIAPLEHYTPEKPIPADTFEEERRSSYGTARIVAAGIAAGIILTAVLALLGLYLFATS